MKIALLVKILVLQSYMRFKRYLRKLCLSFVTVNVSVFIKMEKIEYYMIKFLHLKGNTPAQIKAELDNVDKDFSPSFAIVKRWAAEFKRGRTSLADDKRLGRPTTATTTNNIKKIHQLVLNDHRIKVREIVEAVNILKKCVPHIVTKELGMRKLTAHWVQSLLTVYKKRI